MKNNTFTKDDTLCVKGVAIMLMLFDHLFSEVIWCDVDLSKLNYFPLGQDLISYLSSSARLCVTLFAFLTVYAMTVQYDAAGGRAAHAGVRSDLHLIYEKYFSAMSGFWFVFPVGLIMTLFFERSRNFIFVYGYDTDVLRAVWRTLLELLGFSASLNEPTVNYPWWYMGFITIVIIIMPLALRIMNRYVSFAVLAAAAVYMAVTGDMMFMDYLCIPCGIFAARSGIFEKVSKIVSGRIKKYFAALCALVLIALMLKLRQNMNLAPVTDTVDTLLICMLCQNFFNTFRGIGIAVRCIGKYSLNIFALHTLIITLLSDFLYGLGYWILIWAALLAISLLLSVLIEYVKKRTGFNTFVKKERECLRNTDMH